MEKYFKWFLGLGLIIRLVLAPVTYHSDLGAFAQAGRAIVGEGKWLSFYDTMLTPKVDTVFNYQPLAYLIPATFYLPFKGTVLATGDLVKNRDWVWSTTSYFNPLLLLYKFPMLLADLAFLWLLPKFFTDQRKKQLVMLFWAFNPVAIFVSSMMGQVDIIIAFLITAGFYFYQQDRPFYSVILISLSALIKPAGLILIPLLALHHLTTHRKLIPAVSLAFTGFGVYALGILPYLSSIAYRQYALFAEQIGKSTYAAISIASGHDVPWFFIAYLLILILVWHRKLSFMTASAAALLSSLAFSHFHPQWLVWILPWLTIFVISKEDYFLYLVVIACWFIILFSFDPTLHLQLFVHSNLTLPQALRGSPSFFEIVQLARAGLIATLIWIIGGVHETN